ncbi:MAG: metallophosphoesterase [Desulfuromonadales bacterium]|nr:metallophosphoesterase [Desulfuromonadales bacterium]
MSACVLTLIASSAFATPFKFGVMSDTQWPNSPDNKNPNVAVNVIRHINQEMINKGVNFVVQVGDLTDTGGTNNINMDVRATFAQDLYNAGIGFYPLRGNHESSAANAVRFQQIFPQTQNCVNNLTPNTVNTTIYGTQNNTNGTFCVGTTGSFATEATMEGLTYSFDYDNARFVFADQFTKPSGTAKSNLDQTDINWIGDRFASRPANTHAFSFAHKGLVTENHADNMFNSSNPTANQASMDLMESFMQKLQTAGVRYHMGGHDHMHNRAIVKSPPSTTNPAGGVYKLQNIIAASDSYKFYIPPAQTTFNGQSAFRSLETPISQELFTVGYYIFTVDGPKVTADYYAMPNGCGGDCDQTYDVIPYAGNTPTVYPFGSTTPIASYSDPVPFTKHDTFGYSLNGKEVLVAQGGSYALTDDTTKAVANGETGYKGTTAAILNGKNNSTGKDFNLRSLTKSINTGWTPATTGLASDIFTIWGMQDSLATKLTPSGALATNYTFVDPNLTKTDTYALSLSFDPAITVNADFINAGHSVTLNMKDANGNWVNAADLNVGGRKRFILGAYNSAYPLGTYGVDAINHTAWAVINTTNGPAEFAVVQK